MKSGKNTLQISCTKMGTYKSKILIECRNFLKKHSTSNAPSGMIVLRELLENAINHGRTHFENNKITIKLYRNAFQFKIIIEDEGLGFDYKGLNYDNIPDDPRSINKRGYYLINKFSKKIEFNNKGNKITAYVLID